jgi:hypothetical protein
MRFFKWKINLKIKRLDSEQRIKFLSQKLAQEIQSSGIDLVDAGKVGLFCVWINLLESCGGPFIEVQKGSNPIVKYKPEFDVRVPE